MQHTPYSVRKSTFVSAFNVLLTYGHFLTSANLLGRVSSSVLLSFLVFPLSHQETSENDPVFVYPPNDHLPPCAFETQPVSELPELPISAPLTHAGLAKAQAFGSPRSPL